MKHVTLIDWLVIVAYLLSVTVIGMYAASRVKSSASFFITKRKFGKWIMAFLGFGSGTHVDHAVSVAAKTFSVGVSGIWYQWLWLFAQPFYWMLTPLVRRMRIITIADYFQIRYGPSVSVLYALLGVLQLVVALAVMLKGSAVVIAAVSGGELDQHLAIVVMTVRCWSSPLVWPPLMRWKASLAVWRGTGGCHPVNGQFWLATD